MAADIAHSALPDQPQSPTAQLQQQHQHQQQQQQLQQHPLQKKPSKRRTFSFRSDNSFNHRYDLRETAAEKDAQRLHGKADPSLAIQEAEPAAVATTVRASMAPLRSIPHKDALGNPIVDPDRSNPTRSRWERPLDTIRSFEAAIDGAYSGKPYVRPEPTPASWNRRHSQYSQHGPRVPQGAHCGPRTGYARPDGMPDRRHSGRSTHGYPDQQQGNSGPVHTNNGFLAVRQPHPRAQSDSPVGPSRQGDHAVYPPPSNHRSYETMASASGSGSSGEAVGYQTDPTSNSENDSLDRNQSPAKKPEPTNDYGIAFTQVPDHQPPGSNLGFSHNFSLGPRGYQTQGWGGGTDPDPAPPPVPQKAPAVLRKPVNAAVAPVAAPGSSASLSEPKPPGSEKRMSWFRRFSRNF